MDCIVGIEIPLSREMVQNNSVDERAGQKVYYTHTEAKKRVTKRKLKEY